MTPQRANSGSADPAPSNLRQSWSVVAYPWEDPADELDVLARLTAEQIRGERLEAERRQIASMVRSAIGNPSHTNPAYVGSWSDEDLYDYDTDQWMPGRLVVPCRGCERELSPLCSKSRVVIASDWRWVGLDHKQPEADYFFACGWCGTPMLFTVVTPQ